jgi:hypothetical protein
MSSSGMVRRVALVRTDVSEELNASFIRVLRICELGTTLAVTSNRRELVFLRSVRRLIVNANVVPILPILVTLTMEAILSSDGPHGVTSQKTAIFIVTAVKTSNPT